MDNTTQAVRRTLAVLLVSVSFATAACGSEAGSSTPTPVMQTIPEGQFTAEFPSAPIREEETVPTDAGPDVTLIWYRAQLPKETVGIGYVDYPKGVRLSLDAGAEAAASGLNGTVQSKTTTTFMGHPTVDVVIDTPEGPLYQRLVLRGNRLYTLSGAGESGRPASYDRLVETFVMH